MSCYSLCTTNRGTEQFILSKRPLCVKGGWHSNEANGMRCLPTSIVIFALLSILFSTTRFSTVRQQQNSDLRSFQRKLTDKSDQHGNVFHSWWPLEPSVSNANLSRGRIHSEPYIRIVSPPIFNWFVWNLTRVNWHVPEQIKWMRLMEKLKHLVIWLNQIKYGIPLD